MFCVVLGRFHGMLKRMFLVAGGDERLMGALGVIFFVVVLGGLAVVLCGPLVMRGGGSMILSSFMTGAHRPSLFQTFCGYRSLHPRHDIGRGVLGGASSDIIDLVFLTYLNDNVSRGKSVALRAHLIGAQMLLQGIEPVPFGSRVVGIMPEALRMSTEGKSLGCGRLSGLTTSLFIARRSTRRQHHTNDGKKTGGVI